MNLSIRHLQAFDALCTTLNFTRAARRCHLSQPAFSALIQSLESGVGVQLFERSTRSVRLTPAGLAFWPQAQKLLAEMALALEQLRGASAQQSRQVCVALLPSLAAHWLPGVLQSFAAQQPDIQVIVRDVLNAPCCEAVLSGQADLGLASVLSHHPELQSHAVAQEHFFVACHCTHPWALSSNDVCPGDLVQAPFIQMAATTSVRQTVDQWAAQTLPAPLRPLMEVEQLATVMGMVRAGLGVSLVPALSLAYFQDPGIVIRRLQGQPPQRTIYWVSSRDRQLSPAAKRFYRLASSSLEAWLQRQNLQSTSMPAHS